MNVENPTHVEERGVSNTSWGIIKDSARQLRNGYLDRTPIFQYVLLSICFPMWGAAASLNDILIAQFKHIFTLSDFATAFVQSAFYGGYFVIAIPASRVIRRLSYKAGLLIGLTIYILGCLLFFPASQAATYSVFLASLFAVAIGLSFLETSANTYSSMIGPKKTATLRLNISQTFTPIGFFAGALMGKYLIFTEGASLEDQLKGLDPVAAQQLTEQLLQRTLEPYRWIICVLIVLLLLIAITQYPSSKPLDASNHEKSAGLGETLRYLLQKKDFLAGIFAQFMYVGLQTALWSFTIRLALTLDDSLNERAATNYLLAAYVAFFIGKFIANFLITKMNEDLVLIIYSLIGVGALTYVVFVPNITAVWAAVLASGLLGPGWATIYVRTLDTIEDKRFTETGGAIIVMAIIGGAVIPVVQGLISDLTGSMSISFSINILCFLVMALYFWGLYRQSKKA
ncbi:L-fucose:H+ symporter permease [Rothia nasimurium]|uniref:L-fucose:H+ symporter permease n=1 Tax=Rothia nasimurium TaxID=85336 RepID=A0A4Y9F4D4_9MICC|nr:L-fucose:H+ symporter permease [Rothia nasimurium]MBF0808442.1 L-fucose:H+ symporter permease [Rothia nasimurium]TFU22054.1 L-fucose:H+ symporter permease [Rothia nasimurium]